MSTRVPTELATVSLSVNGRDDISAIYNEMVKMFDQVAPAYTGKTNRTELDIKHALKKANELIYREARLKAPRIRPEIQEGKIQSRKNIHLSDPKYMKERSSAGKKFRAKGIIARRIVTFAHPVSTYVAALEYGRDEFLQVMKKKPYGIVGGQTDSWLRKVGAMDAQPFLRKSLDNKAQQAYDEFSSVLKKRWINTLKAVGRHNAKKGKG